MNKIGIIIFSLFTIIILFVNYNHFSKNIPISYYDEEEWVGQSYFYQFYINHNFDRNIWDSNSSKDQPMLTKFVFGYWIYPEYLKMKQYNKELDYSKFLILNGFNPVDGLPQYHTFAKSLGDNFVTLPVGIAGFTENLINVYGQYI